MMKTKLTTTILIGLACLAALAAGCGAPGDRARWPHLKLLVADEARPYAVDLADFLQAYQDRMGTIVEITTAPTAQVLARMEAAAPPDLVVVCDPAAVEAMGGRGLIKPPRWVLEQSRDRLALVTRQDARLKIERLEDLTRPETGTVAIAARENSPTGGLAQDLLRERGLVETLGGRLREFKDLDAVDGAVASGEAALGFVRQSRLARRGGERFKTLLLLDPLVGKQPPYVALVVNGRSERPAAAHQLWGFLETWIRNPGFFLAPKPGSGNVIALPGESS